VDPSLLDRAVDPCVDFYRHACGGWIAKTPIPADRPAWSRGFSEIKERNQTVLRAILEEDAGGKAATAEDPYAAKLGDFFATCMDEAKAESASLQALKGVLARIDTVKDPKSLAQVTASLQAAGADALFDFASMQDYRDATQVIGAADQGGLGLPDRDYYLTDDARSKEIRALYVGHVERMLALAGATPKAAKAGAKTVMELETQLAKVSQTRTERRDPANIYHRLDRAGLASLAPKFAWNDYFATLGAADVQPVNVLAPAFFEKGLNAVVAKTPYPALRTYLRWQAIHAAAPTLGKAFVDEDFRFRSAALTGEKQLLPRWKRCVDATDVALGQALARPFVARTFGAEGKQTAEQLIRGIEAAFGANLEGLAWMDEPTRRAAADKLHALKNQIGYPDVWRNYDTLEIDRTSYLANAMRAAEFETRRDLNKIGKPVDPNDWFMSPPTVNAYYDSSMNQMVFPAGILQKPFFAAEANTAINHGGIGMVMGHELTHGFDDEGRKFDGAGNLREWWTPAVNQAFDQKAQCVANQYSAYAVGDLHLNGQLTLGENIADIGGLKIAYAAMRRARQGMPDRVEGAPYTADQQFFLSYAQTWCTSRRDEYARMLVTVDPHSPPEYRVNGVVANLPEFAAAFSCKAGQPMAPERRCEVW
jgi:predicted metalloendopeptidase